MKITILDREGMTLKTAFPDATAVDSLVAASSASKLSIRKLKSIAEVLAAMARYKLPEGVDCIRVETSAGGAVVARDQDVAVVCVEGIAFPVSVEHVRQSNAQVRAAREQAAKNRWDEITAEISRLGAQPKTWKRDEQIDILDRSRERIDWCPTA